VLAGFEPQTGDEQKRLDELRQALGFDPRLHAERLDARTPGSKKNAVRILAELTLRDHARESACWRHADLAVLAERGARSGLKTYFDELEAHVVPLFAPTSRRG
jgi:hypothetical protein